jgi:hypothetical protein
VANEMTEAVTNIVIGIACLGAFASWLVCAINMFRMVANRREDVALFRKWYENPFNVIFRPGDLTDRGLEARRRCLYGMFGFLAFILLVFVVGLLRGAAVLAN